MKNLLIVHVVPYLERAGTERHVANIFKSLSESCDFILVSPDGPGEIFFPKETTRFVFRRFDHSPFKGMNELRQVLFEIKKKYSNRKILIHVHAAPELAAVIKYFKLDIPIILTVHGYHGKDRFVSYWIAARVTNWFTDFTICISESEKEILLKMGIKREKLGLIYNGVSLTCEKNEKIEKNGESIPTIGCVARLEEPKGINFLIDAVAKVHQEGFRTELIIVGGGSQLENLKIQSEKYPFLSIIFTGHVENPFPYYSMFDIYIQPSLIEPQGITPLEAMRAHLPVIASNVGGLAEVVEDGHTGLLVSPGNSDLLASAIIQLLKNPETARKFGEEGFKRLCAKFTIQQMAGSIFQVYNNLVKKSIN